MDSATPESWPRPVAFLFRFVAVDAVLELLSVFGLPRWWLTRWIAPLPTWTGDTLFDYLQVALILSLSLAIALIWSVLVPGGVGYPRAFAALRLWTRMILGGAMLAYGSAKIIPVQMPPPDLFTLSRPLGELSRMGLLWSFIGSSPPYEICTGMVEMLAGALLMIPRTTLAGSLVSLVVMTQVFLFNICFDVPVKLVSCNLLMMSVFLLAPDLSRVADLLFWHRPASPVRLYPLFASERANRRLGWAQICLGLLIAGGSLLNSYSRWTKAQAVPSPLCGIWSVTRSSGLEERWRQVVIPSPSLMVVQFESAQRERPLRLREENGVLVLREGRLNFRQPTPNTLTLRGQWRGGPVEVDLKRWDEKRYALLQSVHLTQEAP